MAYTIDIQATRRFPAAWARLAARAAKETLLHEGVAEGAALTILLTEDDYLQQLNRDYRGEDTPTDVLSFPAGEPMPGQEDDSAYLGDVAISVPYAERQAAAKGHSTMAELQLLAVHGVLHLLGHDHLAAEEKGRMWAAQAAVLSTLGVGHVQPSEDEHGSEAA